MAEQIKGNSTIEAYDKASEQVSKLCLLRAMFAEDGNPLDYEGAAAGMYYILGEVTETLKASLETLFEAAIEAKAEDE
jgi:hypothetical protein